MFSLHHYCVVHRWQNCCLGKIPWRERKNTPVGKCCDPGLSYWLFCPELISMFIQWKHHCCENMTVWVCNLSPPGYTTQYVLNSDRVDLRSFKVCVETTCAFRLWCWQLKLFPLQLWFYPFFPWWAESLYDHAPGRNPKGDRAFSMAAPSLRNSLKTVCQIFPICCNF